MTGTRPFVSLITNRITSMCSSWLNVGDSPVVPTGTRPSIPAAICCSTSQDSFFSSTFPLRKGVTSAVYAPVNIGGLVSEFDDAVEHKIGRAFERHVADFVAVDFEIHFKRVAALNFHTHRRLREVDQVRND